MTDTQTVEATRHAEDMLLGSIMLAACFQEGRIEQPDLKECLKLVKPEHFSHPEHGRYYKAMQDCEQPDIVGTILQLAKTGLQKPADNRFLIKLTNDTPTEFDLMHYAKVVVELWEQRTGKSRRRRGIAT